MYFFCLRFHENNGNVRLSDLAKIIKVISPTDMFKVELTQFHRFFMFLKTDELGSIVFGEKNLSRVFEQRAPAVVSLCCFVTYLIASQYGHITIRINTLLFCDLLSRLYGHNGVDSRVELRVSLQRLHCHRRAHILSVSSIVMLLILSWA